MKVTAPEFQQWERFYRANFINSLSGYKSASLIGTCNAGKQTNLAIFSNIVHLGADPALIGFINRPLAASVHTISNIEETGYYTINHIHPGIVERAHQTSAKYPQEISEFNATLLAEEWTDFPSPYVKESFVKYGLKYAETIRIERNNTFLVIGEIVEVYLPDAVVQPDGFIGLEDAHSIASLGLDTYYLPKLLNKFKYAKPQ
jgi:flavin reductase (DIM6/NTAB) family NADH-FMN oxidoreductase RutF